MTGFLNSDGYVHRDTRGFRNIISWFAASCFLIAAGCSDPAQDVKVERSISFNRDIRPILSDNCFFCHGPDEPNNKANLRLDSQEAAVAAGVLVPGSAAESEMIRRITSEDSRVVMPPAHSIKSLTEEQKTLLKRWVDEGAVYEDHWSYSPLKRAPGRTIDTIIERGLAELGLAYSDRADEAVLIRRLYLDITGLPPTLEELDAIMSDRSPDAYERLVDRLLVSPHYGEKMAISWLDAVRFADTVGYHGDQDRDATPFRDYVIDAFNSNKPFDRFTIEQLAGDLLPDPTLKQRVASSFNRLNQLSAEGGIQDKEYIKKYQSERVRTASTAWLGSTLACAECHDHKFDPYTAKDFYSFAAFFADILEKGAWNGDGRYQVKDINPYMEKIGAKIIAEDNKDFGPLLSVPNGTFMADRAGLEQEHAARKQALLEGSTANEKEFNDWLAHKAELRAQGIPSHYDIPYTTNAVSEAIQRPIEYARKLDFEINIAIHWQRWFTHYGLVLTFDQGERFVRWHHSLEREGIKTIDQEKVWVETDWTMVSLNMDELEMPPNAVLESIEFVSSFLKDGSNIAYTARNFELITDRHSVPDGELSSNSVSRLERYLAQELDDEGLKELRDTFMMDHAGTPDSREKRTRYRLLDDFIYGERTTLATISGPPREMRVLPRGNWMDESGEVVLPSTPHFLPDRRESVTVTNQLTRLDLAEWLVSKENPLTSRTYMNRLWAQFFGRALSSAPEDLGTQGEYPAYPDLLDWLSLEFMESGWDVKHMVKTIVMSEAYQQTAVASDELMELDPDNRFLARQSPRRMPAETVRDNALAASGLLVRRIGGGSVKPYQPKGYYQHLNFPTRTYEADLNENQYRRGVYMHWQRTFLHPMLVAFNAPGRDECAVSRPQSNTPLQALNLLNDPTFLEAAKALAAKVLMTDSDDLSRISRAFKSVLVREPTPQERDELLAFLEIEQTRFAANRTDAAAFVDIGIYKPPANISKTELAAWMSVCRAILNLNETITIY